MPLAFGKVISISNRIFFFAQNLEFTPRALSFPRGLEFFDIFTRSALFIFKELDCDHLGPVIDGFTFRYKFPDIALLRTKVPFKANFVDLHLKLTRDLHPKLTHPV